MTTILNIGTKVSIPLTIDNPHLLIVGGSGAGKTVLCEVLTEHNRNLRFVYLGREERNSAGHRRPFHEVPDRWFFGYDVSDISPLETLLTDAAQCAIDNGAILIIEDINLYLRECHKQFFEVLTDLTAAGRHVVLTTQGKPDDTDLRRLAIGNVVWVGAETEPLTFHTLSIERMVEGGVLSSHHDRAPLGRLYPELSGIHAFGSKVGGFVLRTPAVVMAGLVVPPPTSITTKNKGGNFAFLRRSR